MTFSKKKGFHRIDAWRGYDQPVYAVGGASDSGESYDSPARSSTSKQEVSSLAKYLNKRGIKTRKVLSHSSNAFMAKRWVIVQPEDYPEAKKLSDRYIKEHERDTSLLHEADVFVKTRKKEFKEHKKRKMKRL